MKQLITLVSKGGKTVMKDIPAGSALHRNLVVAGYRVAPSPVAVPVGPEPPVEDVPDPVVEPEDDVEDGEEE